MCAFLRPSGSGSRWRVGRTQSASTTGTTGTTGTGTTGFFESDVLLKLVRPALPTCAASTLSGAYALVGAGTGIENLTSTTGTGTTGTTGSSNEAESPFFFFGLLQFDGNGNVVAPVSTTGSTTTSSTPVSGSSIANALGYLQFTGTYTVSSDCSGIMTITSNTNGMGLTAGSGTTSTTGTSTTGTGTTGTTATSTTMPSTITVDFVLAPATIAVNQSASAGRYAAPELEFSFSSGSETILGHGIAQ